LASAHSRLTAWLVSVKYDNLMTSAQPTSSGSGIVVVSPIV